jgi:hypothetical protein
MRTVRGIDFDELTVDELGAISAWLRQQPVAIAKLVPREYQIEALAKIGEAFEVRARPFSHGVRDRQNISRALGSGST